MTESVRPARPHHKFTEDGRRVREVLTYSRRGSRLSSAQQQAWDSWAEAYVIPEESVDESSFDLTAQFAVDAPLIVEVGCGVGEATAVLAQQRPEHNIVGFEVWRPGVADALGRLGAAGVENVRLTSVDGVWSLEHLVDRAQLAEFWTFFPDPWPKARHHKRRLVTPDFAALVASRLKPGGVWRLATDWAEYAEQMIAVLDAEPSLVGGVVPRWQDRPVTRFERRGVAEGRPPIDLLYRRRT